jgi:RNA polymerase sigma factor
LHGAEEVITEIQTGNESLREDFIEFHKAFIFRYSSFICKRTLSWENDEELSVALIAFNKAIDKFETGRSMNFIHYARILIRNSLIDYFREQKDSQLLFLEGGNTDSQSSPGEEEISVKHHAQETENRDRIFEIQVFKEELFRFGITLVELPEVSPKHYETREFLKATALRIAGNGEIMKKLTKDKKLPMKEIQVFTGIARKSLERWRKYLLALIIILANPDLELLDEYIRGRRMESDPAKCKGNCGG